MTSYESALFGKERIQNYHRRIREIYLFTHVYGYMCLWGFLNTCVSMHMEAYRWFWQSSQSVFILVFEQCSIEPRNVDAASLARRLAPGAICLYLLRTGSLPYSPTISMGSEALHSLLHYCVVVALTTEKPPALDTKFLTVSTQHIFPFVSWKPIKIRVGMGFKPLSRGLKPQISTRCIYNIHICLRVLCFSYSLYIYTYICLYFIKWDSFSISPI